MSLSHWNRSTSIIAMPENKTSRHGRTSRQSGRPGRLTLQRASRLCRDALRLVFRHVMLRTIFVPCHSTARRSVTAAIRQFFHHPPHALDQQEVAAHLCPALRDRLYPSRKTPVFRRFTPNTLRGLYPDIVFGAMGKKPQHEPLDEALSAQFARFSPEGRREFVAELFGISTSSPLMAFRHPLHLGRHRRSEMPSSPHTPRESRRLPT
jgi:hypothetical protein